MSDRAEHFNDSESTDIENQVLQAIETTCKLDHPDQTDSKVKTFVQKRHKNLKNLTNSHRATVIDAT